MRQAFYHSAAHRRRLWTLAAASGLVLALAAPGSAMQCPRSQIFWKSKNKCIEKAEAAKLGFYHGPIPKQDQTKPAPAQPAAETAAPPAPDAPAAPQQPAAPEPAALQPFAAPAAAAPPSAAPSPYGALPTDAFNKTK
jgi:hypothetical protein